MFKKTSTPKGFALIEIIVAVAIMVILVTVSASMFITSRRTAGQAFIQNSAALTLAESREMLKHMQNQDAELLQNGIFYLTRESEFDSWHIQSDFPDEDLFVRQVTIQDAERRQSDGDLYLPDDTGPGYTDPATKKINVQILWAPDFIPTDLLNQTLYFSNWDDAYTF